jgi:GT2 family glycosyltransferase
MRATVFYLPRHRLKSDDGTEWMTKKELGPGADGSFLPAKARKKKKAGTKPDVRSDFPEKKKENLFKKSLQSLSSVLEMDLRFREALTDPSVSVVIVHREGTDLLGHCLFALKTQVRSADEVIVVINGSLPESVELVQTEYPKVKLLESGENLGYALGANLGARYATGDLIVLLGDQMVPTPDWLGRLVEEFQREWPQAGVVSSWISPNQKLDEYPSGMTRDTNFLGKRVEGVVLEEKTILVPEGPAFMYARHLALEGPFDTDYVEEPLGLAFGWKINLAGKKVFTTVKAKVFQKENPGSLGIPLWKRTFYAQRNRWMCLCVFYEFSYLLRIAPWFLLDVLLRLGRGLLTSPSEFLGTLSAVLWMFFHTGLLGVKRRLAQEKRKGKDEEIVALMTGRVVGDHIRGARWLNGLSLFYCRFTGLRVRENRAVKPLE